MCRCFHSQLPHNFNSKSRLTRSFKDGDNRKTTIFIVFPSATASLTRLLLLLLLLKLRICRRRAKLNSFFRGWRTLSIDKDRNVWERCSVSFTFFFFFRGSLFILFAGFCCVGVKPSSCFAFYYCVCEVVDTGWMMVQKVYRWVLRLDGLFSSFFLALPCFFCLWCCSSCCDNINLRKSEPCSGLNVLWMWLAWNELFFLSFFFSKPVIIIMKYSILR